jgi:PAS domain S-box-containing protein
MLPGISGYDVLLKLRTIESLKDIPILAITACGKDEAEPRAMGLGFDEYIPKPVEIAPFQQLIISYLSGEKASFQKEGNPSTIREYSIDLIDRLQATIEDLRTEKKFTESIIQSLSSGLMVLDLEGIIVAINPGGRKILNDFSDMIEGESLANVIGAKEASAMTEIKSDKLHYRNEIVLRTRTGDERMVGFTTVPRENAVGKRVGTIISFRDITDVQYIQKEMEKINRLSTVAEIASAVAHEIRNPLAGIKTMAQSIDENLSEADGNKEYIRRIVKQVDRLNDILKGFFTYARPAKPRIVRASLMNIIQEVKPLVKNRLEDKKIVFTTNYEKDLPCILADPNQIQQVFLNLILNATDALSFAGRIEVSARTLREAEKNAYSLIYPKLKDGGNYVIVHFKDNGCGMPRSVSEKIFEPFFTTKVTGSGLGLSIVYRILRENNAAIFVDSTEGVGTTFILFFEIEGKWEKFSL